MGLPIKIISRMDVVGTLLVPALGRQLQTDLLSSRLAQSVESVPGQINLCRGTLYLSLFLNTAVCNSERLAGAL